MSGVMKTYATFKAKHPDYVLFIRAGDFYELFHDDAKKAAKTLGITLTTRTKGDESVPMAGVPAYAIDGYVKQMIASGHKCALAGPKAKEPALLTA